MTSGHTITTSYEVILKYDLIYFSWARPRLGPGPGWGPALPWARARPGLGPGLAWAPALAQATKQLLGGPHTNQAKNSSEMLRAQHESGREFIEKRIKNMSEAHTSTYKWI